MGIPYCPVQSNSLQHDSESLWDIGETKFADNEHNLM
jgi:hypothetical protein